MSNPDPDFEEIRESVDEAKKPGTFKIVDVLQNRGMPKMEVTVSVDEQAAYDASVAKEKIEDLDSKYSKTKKPDDIIAEQEKWEDVRSEALERLRASSFTFHLEGISEGQRNDIFARAKKKYPIEYDQDIDLNTGKMEKTEKESPERDALYTDLLWNLHIKKIVNSDGDEQADVSYSDIRTMRDNMPISATAKINESIEKLRVSTAVFMMEADEDFLANPSPGPSTE